MTPSHAAMSQLTSPTKRPKSLPPAPRPPTKNNDFHRGKIPGNFAIHGSIPPKGSGIDPQGPLLGFWRWSNLHLFWGSICSSAVLKAKRLETNKKLMFSVCFLPSFLRFRESPRTKGFKKEVHIELPSSCIKGFQGTYVSIA